MSEKLETNRIIEGDCLEVLDELPAESVHSIVCDPPYGLAFMSRDWDDFEPKEYQEWCENWSRRAKRVLKPGGHLLAFSGNRTHHRLFTGVEDAGFEIRDTVTWHYGSGFPKASDVSKTIDKRAGAEREVVGELEKPASTGRVETLGRPENSGSGWNENPKRTAPATDEAKKWDGWKTGLKPATEFVVMARKPFDGATVDSVLNHGTGALNIDGCRIPITDDGGDGNWSSTTDSHDGDAWNDETTGLSGGIESSMNDQGRYPSNVVFDAAAADVLDERVGELSTGEYDLSKHADRNQQDKYGTFSGGNERTGKFPADSGGPSRYFYTSKASKSERTLEGKIENAHPTVKPTDLMEWMVKLVSAEGQLVLDPFAGSGTTCAAAKTLGREFIGIEKQAKWADVARVRCGLTPSDPANVRADDSQSGLEAFADGGFIE